MNQFLGSLALLPVEKVLNAILVRDPHVAAKFSAFDSKCIEVLSRRPDFSLNIRFEDGSIKLSAIDCQTLGIQADATISGRAESLLELLAKSPDQRALADANIDISGDGTLVQDLHVTIQALDADWRDYLAPILGDVITQELGEAQDNAREWSKSARVGMQRGIRDYLSEEARLVPSELEVDSFANRLDHARLRLDRLAARTELLKRRTNLLMNGK